MATNDTLRADVNGLLTEAKRSAMIAVNRKLSEATLQNALGNSRVAFTVLDAIETEGGAFIEAIMAPYRGAANSKASRIPAKATLRDALESYLSDGTGWGRSDPAFGDGRNGLLDRDYEPMAERLRQKLEREARVVDSEPKKPFWERHPVGVGLTAVGTLVGVIALLVSIFKTG